jgi:DNA ligase-1
MKEQSCENMSHLKKYAERSGPPYPAVPCEGRTILGNDGYMYISEKRGKSKISRWYKLSSKSPKKILKKSLVKSVKPKLSLKQSPKKRISKSKKDCPEGKERNPKTGRCIKIKSLPKSPKKIKKSIKQSSPKKISKKLKDTPKKSKPLGSKPLGSKQLGSKQLGSKPLGSKSKGSKVVFEGGPLLAKEYIDKDGKRSKDVIGWWASEKYDGYRAIWNGKYFVSRNGNRYEVPNWFKNLMPPGIALDGEFWLGRGKFQDCGIFRKKIPDDNQWKRSGVMYNVFDLPASNKPFEDRMTELERIVRKQCKNVPNCPLVYTQQVKIKSISELDKMFNDVIKKGGEGLMIRKPGSKYEQKRSSTLLKYKQFGDTECKIIGYKDGTGKYAGMLGSFTCELLKGSKKHFNVSGMNDCIRKTYKKTHPIGTIITIIFNEKTNDGIPRFPRYLRKRDDANF